MHVAVLGGGLQGCCVALALADRGLNVTLIDRNATLLSRTAVANEGKIHLGYMYAADPTFSTARMMIQGALAFAPFMSRYLGVPLGQMPVSVPAIYAVHRDSQHGADHIAAYLTATHRLIEEASSARPADYFGLDLRHAPRRRSEGELAASFCPEHTLAAFDTVEVAIDPQALARAVRARIADDRRIEVRLDTDVLAAEAADDGIMVLCRNGEDRSRERFDHAVNALWDGRIALDATMGHRPQRPWLHRLKYGVSFRIPPGARRPPSATFVSGPFGEVVSYGDGLTYLTWYSQCLREITDADSPPHWETYPADPLKSEIAGGTIGALAEVVPSLRALCRSDLVDIQVKGGAIVAWGSTDIHDSWSELHRRFEIGITSVGRYHSVDPGKLTMAPFFGEACAGRIAPGS
jgi:glycine/D-amino acid oxidase-like deaminating enzyme